MSKKRVYSDDERVIRIWDIETVKDLMSRRQVMQMNNERREELETLWVTEPKYTATASLGSNWGYYVGMDEISRHYVAEYTDTLQKALDEKCAANAAIENIRDNFGYGDLIAHHVSTPWWCWRMTARRPRAYGTPWAWNAPAIPTAPARPCGILSVSALIS